MSSAGKSPVASCFPISLSASQQPAAEALPEPSCFRQASLVRGAAMHGSFISCFEMHTHTHTLDDVSLYIINNKKKTLELLVGKINRC